MDHVVLVGDSVLDNGAYVGSGPDVSAQLQEKLGATARVTLLARDGAVVAGVSAQLERLPRDATHLVISAGGNDALAASGILQERATSVADVLSRFAAIQSRFGEDYRALLEVAGRTRLPALAATIYDPRFPDPVQRELGRIGLFVFNDAITRQAFARGMSLMDLRLICNEDEDFANAIEPSPRGGQKIARAISRFIRADGQAPQVFAR